MFDYSHFIFLYSTDKNFTLYLVTARENGSIIRKGNKITMGVFVNCSNHPSGGWLKAQKDAAEKYGTIIDIPFPAVKCNLTDQQMENLAEQMTAKIMEIQPEAVMCMGEFVLCFRIVQKLKAKGIRVLASCSERKAVEHLEEDGTIRKESIFTFNGFREY